MSVLAPALPLDSIHSSVPRVQILDKGVAFMFVRFACDCKTLMGNCCVL